MVEWVGGGGRREVGQGVGEGRQEREEEEGGVKRRQGLPPILTCSLSLSLSLSWEYTGGGGGRWELRNEMKRACAGVVTDCVNHQVARTGRVPRCDWSEARGWEGVGREGHAPETAWARTPARVQH